MFRHLQEPVRSRYRHESPISTAQLMRECTLWRRRSLIVVTPYFSLRLRDSPRFSTSASSWVPLIFTAANLVFLLYSTYAQKSSGFKGIERKIFGCIGLTAAMIALLLFSTSMRAVDPTGFFILLV